MWNRHDSVALCETIGSGAGHGEENGFRKMSSQVVVDVSVCFGCNCLV